MLRGRPFSRRASDGAYSSSPVAPTPLTIFGASLLTWRRSEDATQAAGLLTAWPDKIGGGAITIVGAPTVNTSDATLNGPLGNRQTVSSDGGVAAALQQTLDRPSPSVEPTLIMAVIRQNTWTAADVFWGTGANVMQISQVGASPALIARNSTVGPSNGDLAIGAWRLLAMFVNNSTTDYTRVGQNAKATGTNLGVVDPGATWTWMARTLAGFADISLAEMMICNRDFSGSDFANFITYLNTIYPAGVGA